MDAIKKIPTGLPGVFVLEPRVFGDERGFFLESYNERVFSAIGINERFVQDNHSFSARDVLRGLHYQRMLWIPAQLAHGFHVISETAHVFYKTTDYYAPEFERTLAWNDPDLNIDWELNRDPTLSAKDQRGIALRKAETFE